MPDLPGLGEPCFGTDADPFHSRCAPGFSCETNGICHHFPRIFNETCRATYDCEGDLICDVDETYRCRHKQLHDLCGHSKDQSIVRNWGPCPTGFSCYRPAEHELFDGKCYHNPRWSGEPCSKIGSPEQQCMPSLFCVDEHCRSFHETPEFRGFFAVVEIVMFIAAIVGVAITAFDSWERRRRPLDLQAVEVEEQQRLVPHEIEMGETVRRRGTRVPSEARTVP